MADPVLQVEGLTKRFGGLLASDGIDIELRHGEIHALIGPNGAGKTTLLAQLTGELAPNSGRIRFDGQDITRLPVHARSRLGVARTFQITSILPNFTAEDNVALAVQAHAGHSFRFWTPARNATALRTPARDALDQVGLLQRAGITASALSHGEHRQLEVAMALATKPRVLLMDEPMAGMGPEESAGMVKLLKALKANHAILLVEHDMDAVFALADRISVLVYGRIIATGTPDSIRSNPEVRQAYLGDSDA